MLKRVYALRSIQNLDDKVYPKRFVVLLISHCQAKRSPQITLTILHESRSGVCFSLSVCNAVDSTI